MINIDAWDRKCDDLNKALSKNKKLKKQLEQAEKWREKCIKLKDKP